MEERGGEDVEFEGVGEGDCCDVVVWGWFGDGVGYADGREGGGRGRAGGGGGAAWC